VRLKWLLTRLDPRRAGGYTQRCAQRAESRVLLELQHHGLEEIIAVPHAPDGELDRRRVRRAAQHARAELSRERLAGGSAQKRDVRHEQRSGMLGGQARDDRRQRRAVLRRRNQPKRHAMDVVRHAISSLRPRSGVKFLDGARVSR
jgi:hypothetical protein